MFDERRAISTPSPPILRRLHLLLLLLSAILGAFCRTGSPFTHFRLCPYQVHWENNHLFRRDEFIEAQCFFFRWILPRARGRIGRISLAFFESFNR